MLSLARSSVEAWSEQDQLSLQLPLALCGLDAELGRGGGLLLQFPGSGITARAAEHMGLLFLAFPVSVSHVFPYDCPRKFAWFYSLERNDSVSWGIQIRTFALSPGRAMYVRASQQGKIGLLQPNARSFLKPFFH